ncbi:hypothetical protein CAPTEDRAFT_188180 [Capitella teleta]|uniref:Uncharacterized protein n=1 Tax=Capitella teleta TaxID=283909 RepID=R7TS27_CAPTE|nr:hypothetical protein CAPTEDRAFT_188180 [Capitella teleta]|eukprot:ELT96397.1 hypothetical protein CAPTEDRAFT_188180 [Capitella teleta]
MPRDHWKPVKTIADTKTGKDKSHNDLPDSIIDCVTEARYYLLDSPALQFGKQYLVGQPVPRQFLFRDDVTLIRERRLRNQLKCKTQSNRQVPQLELLQSRICYNYQPSAHELTQKANPDKLVEALRNMTRSSYQHLAEASHHLHQILSYENTHEAPSLSEDIEDLRTSHDHTLCQLHRLHNHLSVNGPHSDTPCHAWRCFIQSMPRPTDHCLTPGDRTTSRLNHILLLQQSRDKLGNILNDFSAAEHELHSASKRSGDDI